jgi:hypothetical protein
VEEISKGLNINLYGPQSNPKKINNSEQANPTIKTFIFLVSKRNVQVDDVCGNFSLNSSELCIKSSDIVKTLYNVPVPTVLSL